MDDRVDLLRRSVAALAEQPDGRRLLLFVDDAHLLDDASATLVHQVAAPGRRRPGHGADGRAGPRPRGRPVEDGLAERVEIVASPKSIDELLRAVLDGAVDPATAVVRRAVASTTAVPARARDRRARGRQPAGRREHLASRLEAVAFSAWSRSSRAGSAGSARREAGSMGSWPTASRSGRTSWRPCPTRRSPRGSSAAPARQPPGRRSSRHPPGPSHLRRRRARHRCAQGDRPVPGRGRRADRPQARRGHPPGGYMAPPGRRSRADVLLEGAAIARWRYDFPLAERLARPRSARGGVRRRPARRDVASLQGRRDEAEAEFTASRRRPSTTPGAANVAVARYQNAAWSGRAELPMLDQAGGAVAGGRHDRLLARRLVVLLDRRAHGRPPTRRGRSSPGPGARPSLRLPGRGVRPGAARPPRRRRRADRTGRGRAPAHRHATGLVPWWHTVVRCLTLRYAGRFAEAQDLIAAHHGEALAEGRPRPQAVFAVLEADAVGDRGRARPPPGAKEALAVDQLLDRPVLVRRDRMVGALASALARRRRRHGGAGRARRLGPAPVLLDEVDLLRRRAWTSAAAGDIPGACAAVRRRRPGRGDRRRRGPGHRPRPGPQHAQDVCAGWSTSPHASTVTSPPPAKHAAALAKGDGGARAVSHDFEAMGADLLAEAAADASVALRLAGDVRGSAAAGRRAGKLVERCEDPVTRRCRRSGRGPGSRRPSARPPSSPPVAAPTRRSPSSSSCPPHRGEPAPAGVREARHLGSHRARRGADGRRVRAPGPVSGRACARPS